MRKILPSLMVQISHHLTAGIGEVFKLSAAAWMREAIPFRSRDSAFGGAGLAGRQAGKQLKPTSHTRL